MKHLGGRIECLHESEKKMLFDFKIPRPEENNAYDLHRMVALLSKDEKERHLFCDYGEHIRMRSRKSTLDKFEGHPVIAPDVGAIAFIELRASCYVSSGGKKYFLKQGDWRGRHKWLEKKAVLCGFSVLNVSCQSHIMKVKKPGAEFSLDCTDFSACIKIQDKEKVKTALSKGIGSKGRAFGFGMLVL